MLDKYLEDLLERTPLINERANQLSKAMHRAVLNGGASVRKAVDLLHGTWLGHPLHPVLTDVTIGAWLFGTLFDGLALTSGSRQAEQTADTLTAIGVTSAIPTAMAGLADFSGIPKRAAGTGLLHALINDIALTLYGLSLWDRKKGRRGRAILFSGMALGCTLLAAWLGGHLSFRQRVGVNHSDPVSKPEAWTGVLAEEELAEHEARRVEVEGLPVLLYRYGGTVYAISAVCSHAGGPLEEGKFEELCVQCPWHDSVFDLRNGTIVHGPATHPQPNYAARFNNGQIEIRVA